MRVVGRRSEEHNPESNAVRPTVLLLDDELSIRHSLGRFLELAGYNVLTVADVDEAFEILAHSEVSAVIADVRMPEHRSGLELVEFVRLNADWSELPVLVLTGVRLTSEEEDIIRRHHAYVFYKPHGYSDIASYLNQLLRRG